MWDVLRDGVQRPDGAVGPPRLGEGVVTRVEVFALFEVAGEGDAAVEAINSLLLEVERLCGLLACVSLCCGV